MHVSSQKYFLTPVAFLAFTKTSTAPRNVRTRHKNNVIAQYGKSNVHMHVSIAPSTYHLVNAPLAAITASGILSYDGMMIDLSSSLQILFQAGLRYFQLG